MNWLPIGVLTTLLAACTSGSSQEPELDPPANTGSLTIDMADRWRVVEVQVLEQAGGTRQPDPPTGRFLMPPAVGAHVTLDDQGFVRVDGFDLANLCPPETSRRTRRINRADQRFAQLDYGCRALDDPAIADDEGSARVEVALGAVGPNSMIGFVRFEVTGFRDGSLPSGGLYRVALLRDP